MTDVQRESLPAAPSPERPSVTPQETGATTLEENERRDVQRTTSEEIDALRAAQAEHSLEADPRENPSEEHPENSSEGANGLSETARTFFADMQKNIGEFFHDPLGKGGEALGKILEGATKIYNKLSYALAGTFFSGFLNWIPFIQSSPEMLKIYEQLKTTELPFEPDTKDNVTGKQLLALCPSGMTPDVFLQRVLKAVTDENALHPRSAWSLKDVLVMGQVVAHDVQSTARATTPTPTAPNQPGQTPSQASPSANQPQAPAQPGQGAQPTTPETPPVSPSAPTPPSQ
jgi:hypothetical protein